KLNSPWSIYGGERRHLRARQYSRGRGRGMAENQKHRFARRKMERYSGATVVSVEVCLLNGAGVWVPEFCLFTVHTEAHSNLLRLITAIGDEVDICLSGAAMNPRQRGV